MVLGIIQARTSSSRLPGKVLRPILGEPMIFRQLDRLRDSKRVSKWILATSNDASDFDLVNECKKRNILHFAGSLNDVLDRYYQAAKQYSPEFVVRVTGDCPVIDPEILDQVVDFHIENKFEYSSNGLVPTFPDGLDCEIMNWAVLERAWNEAILSSEREHVTSFIYKDHETKPKFKIGIFRSKNDCSSLRLTVDEPQDFELITKIYEELYPANKKFRFREILELLQAHPQLATINNKIIRNEGYLKSLAEDRVVSKPKLNRN